jgi:DNA-binding transcriptional LysR family regulator
METRRLEYFLALAQEGNFTRAATRLGLSQPALSQQIRKLENELGVELVDRSRQPIGLTPAGRGLYARSHRMLEDVAGIKADALETRRGSMGRLRVGIAPSLLFSRLPQLIRSFLRANPKVEISVYRESTRNLIEMLEGGRADVILTFTRPTPSNITWRELYSDRYFAILPSDHRLAAQESVSLTQLRDEPFLMFNRSATPENYDAFISACVAADFTPREVFIQDAGFVDRIGLVGAGLGVGVIPGEIALRGLDGVVYRPIIDPQIDVITTISWSRSAFEATTTAFVKHCLQPFRTSPVGAPPVARER